MPKEGRFYVEYLGWKETRGLYGNDYLDPIMWKLLSRSETFRSLHRMTIKVNKDELQILQHVTAPNGKPQKIKYPAQQMCDVSYVAQSPAPHTDVVGCIFLGYNAKTRCAAHVHAYRFDSADTAAMFVKLVRSIIEQADLRERIIAMEQDLFRLGHIGVRTSLQEPDGMGSDGGSYGSHSSHSPNSSDSGAPRTYPRPEDAFKARKDIVIVKRTPSQKSAESSKLFNSMQDELSQKLEKDVPILLPPKDYDTIVRRYGHLSIRAKVKQRPVIGPDSVFRPPMEKSHSADGNNNPPQDRQRGAVGHALKKSSSSNSNEQVDVTDGASSQSSVEEDASVYGLYKGLKQEKVSTSAQHMAMWSPEFSFNTQSSSSRGSESASPRLRRVRVPAK